MLTDTPSDATDFQNQDPNSYINEAFYHNLPVRHLIEVAETLWQLHSADSQFRTLLIDQLHNLDHSRLVVLIALTQYQQLREGSPAYETFCQKLAQLLRDSEGFRKPPRVVERFAGGALVNWLLLDRFSEGTIAGIVMGLALLPESLLEKVAAEI